MIVISFNLSNIFDDRKLILYVFTKCIQYIVYRYYITLDLLLDTHNCELHMHRGSFLPPS